MGYIKVNSGHVRAIFACGKMLFTTHGDFKIRVWDISLRESFRPKKITTLPQRNPLMLFSKKNIQQHREHISCIAYNHDDKLLYTGSWDRTLKAWKINEKHCVDLFAAHKGHINAIVINQEDGCVFTCSSDGSVKFGEGFLVKVLIF